ncbi:MAG: hypothetical protein M3409_12385 [Gemmatimonadota bacterium]|nr:hypothetical protein [Gemmatimonadota bacterium]
MAIRQDVLLRLVRQIAAVLAHATGLRRAGKLDEARAEIDAARQAHFGPLAELLPFLDPESAARMLGGVERVLAWAALLEEEAHIREALGETSSATGLRARAASLLGRAREGAPEHARRIEEALRSLSA